MPYSSSIANATLQQTPLIPAPPRTPQPELIIYSLTTHFSNPPINFAITYATQSSELPQPVNTVSNKNETPPDITNSEPLSPQLYSPTPSQIAKKLT